VIDGVRRHLPGYLVASAGRVADAWGVSGSARTTLDGDLERAAATATDRVTAELGTLFALDPAAQHATPLELVRGAVREPTEALRAAGVGAVVRDEFDERHHPGDVYDLAPRAVGDLGDPDLGPELLAWGLAKARVLRARALRHPR
jgi:predicted deacetylase